jgi:hypothetical protein
MRNRNAASIVIFFLLLLIVVWLIYQHNKSTQSSPRPSVSSEIPPTYSVGQRTKENDCHVNGPFQDKACTPGAIFSDITKEQVCVRGYAKSVRHVPANLKREVFREYGITHHSKGKYEVDHLISLELGGSNDIANLFPEAAEPRPGFHEKDKVENYLHREVCSGRISLSKAQGLIANNWLEVYKSMIGKEDINDANDDESPQ